MAKKWVCCFGLVMLIALGHAVPVKGSSEIQEPETGGISGNWESEPETGAIQEFLEEEAETEGLNFKEVYQWLKEGDLDSLVTKGKEVCRSVLKENILEPFDSLKMIFGILLFCVFFRHLAEAFSASGAGETGFFIAFLLLAGILLKIFDLQASIGERVIQGVLRFMTLLIPVFFSAVAYAGGTGTAMAFYQMILLVIGGVQWLFLSVLLPLVRVYVCLWLVNSLFKEDLMTQILKLLELGIEWSMKTLFGIVIGFQVIQGLVLPTADSVKIRAVRKAFGAIPWIGNSGDLIADIMLGSGTVIKNAIGMAGVVIMLILCLGPVLRLGISALLYQGTAALLQPVAEGRLLECIQGTAKGIFLVMKLVFYTVLLFTLTLAIACGSTNLIH